MGYRERGYGRFYPGNGPFRDLPPWERPGWLYGTGVDGAVTADPYSCQRFPWLPRRWWASPSLTGDTPVASAKRSKQIIEQQIAAAESQITTLRKRLAEFESGDKIE